MRLTFQVTVLSFPIQPRAIFLEVVPPTVGWATDYREDNSPKTSKGPIWSRQFLSSFSWLEAVSVDNESLLGHCSPTQLCAQTHSIFLMPPPHPAPSSVVSTDTASPELLSWWMSVLGLVPISTSLPRLPAFPPSSKMPCLTKVLWVNRQKTRTIGEFAIRNWRTVRLQGLSTGNSLLQKIRFGVLYPSEFWVGVFKSLCH